MDVNPETDVPLALSLGKTPIEVAALHCTYRENALALADAALTSWVLSPNHLERRLHQVNGLPLSALDAGANLGWGLPFLRLFVGVNRFLHAG